MTQPSEAYKKITTGYEPRPLQKKLHLTLKRFNVLVCHRRFGKTVFCINEMIDQGLRNTKPNPRYAYLAPLYGQAKRVAWDYLKMYTANIPGAVSNEADLRVDLPHNGCRFTLLGADNPASLKGIYLDGVILDEYAEMNPAAWREVIRPTLSDRRGWAVFIGTPKGRNAFWEVYDKATSQVDPEWFGAMYKASETKIIDAAELASAGRDMTEEEYEQEFECSFSSGLVGAYYAKQIDAAEKDERITSVPYDPAVPVITSWDLGIGDTTAIWFLQKVGKEIHLIDYLEASGVGLDYYVKELKKRDYVYEEHILPHDAAAKELGTGKTRQESLRLLGIRDTRILERQEIEDGIHAVRMLFPKCWFDREKCARGLDALRNYQKAWDAKNQIFKAHPLHNWASNGSDSFRYLALGLREEAYEPSKNLPREADMNWSVFGYAESNHGGS